MFTIGEFARYAGVTARMLRHYDALGLLVPAAVDPFSGYRRYAPDQLARAHQLVALKELGFSLEQVGQLLDGAGPREVLALLRQRRRELAERLADDGRRLAEVERRLRLVEGEVTMEFQITSLPALRLAQLTGEVREQAEIGGVIGPLFARVYEAYAGNPPQPTVAWYAGAGDGVRLAAAVVEDGEPPSGLESGTLPPVERAMVTTYRGPIEGIGEAWQALGVHLADGGFESAGICREIYHEVHLDGEHDEVIELQQPVV